MREYRRLRTLVTGIVLVYLAIALMLRPVFGRKELFPIFDWSLFARVPNRVLHYGVRILTLGEEELDPTLDFMQATRWFPDAGSIDAHAAIQKLGATIQKGDPARSTAMRTFFEVTYLAGVGPVRYQVVSWSHDPLERWRSGTMTETASSTFDYPGTLR